MIAKGHTDQQIAGLLYIPLRGVEFERAQIMRKLEVSSTSGIVLYALETGLINPCPDEEAHPRRARSDPRRPS
jgi:DNA-binding NarL/FixJ family response regulator